MTELNKADCVTLVRAILSPFLLFLPPFGLSFYIVIAICGISDMLDGYIARRLNTVTKHGEVLDSICDAEMLCICLYCVLESVSIRKEILIFALFTALLRMANIAIGYIKAKKVIMLHTRLNKLTGALLFAFVLAIKHIDVNLASSVLCIIALIATVEEGILILREK